MKRFDDQDSTWLQRALHPIHHLPAPGVTQQNQVPAILAEVELIRRLYLGPDFQAKSAGFPVGGCDGLIGDIKSGHIPALLSKP